MTQDYFDKKCAAYTISNILFTAIGQQAPSYGPKCIPAEIRVSTEVRQRLKTGKYLLESYRSVRNRARQPADQYRDMLDRHSVMVSIRDE